MRSRWTICPVQKSEMKYDHQMIQKTSSAKIQLDSLEKAACPGYHLLQTSRMPLLLNCMKYPVSKNMMIFPQPLSEPRHLHIPGERVLPRRVCVTDFDEAKANIKNNSIGRFCSWLTSLAHRAPIRGSWWFHACIEGWVVTWVPESKK